MPTLEEFKIKELEGLPCFICNGGGWHRGADVTELVARLDEMNISRIKGDKTIILPMDLIEVEE